MEGGFVTHEKAIKIIKEYQIEVSEDQALEVLNFLYKIAKLAMKTHIEENDDK